MYCSYVVFGCGSCVSLMYWIDKIGIIFLNIYDVFKKIMLLGSGELGKEFADGGR